MSSVARVAGGSARTALSPVAVTGLGLLIWTLGCLDHSLFGYAIPGMMSEFGVGVTAVGYLLSASFIFAAVATIGVGLLADRYGRRIMLCLCLAGSALLVAAMGLSGSIVSLAMLRILGFGIGNGLSPLTSAFVAEGVPYRFRALALGILQCGYAIGWATASLFAAPLISAYGWRTVFICAIPVAGLAVLLFPLLPAGRPAAGKARSPETARPRLGEFAEPALLRRVALCALAFFAYGGAYAGTAFYLPTYFTVVRGFDAETATRIVGWSYGIAIVGYLAATLSAQYWTTRRKISIIWCALGALTFPLFLWVPNAAWQDIVLFGLTAIFFYGASAVLITFAVDLFPARLRATGMALSASLGINIGFALFPSINAWLIEEIGWQETFSVVVPSLLLIAAGALWACGEPPADAMDDES